MPTRCTATTQKGTQCSKNATHGDVCGIHSDSAKQSRMASSHSKHLEHATKHLTPAQLAMLARAKTPKQWKELYTPKQEGGYRGKFAYCK